MVNFRDNRLMHLTRHDGTMQSLRFRVAAAAVAVMCASIIKVASEKEAAP
jgi:hypothetical protein